MDRSCNFLLLGCLRRRPNLDAGMTVTLAGGTPCYLPACMLFRHVRTASKLVTFLSPLSLSNRQFLDWASPPYRAQKTSINSSAKAESIIWLTFILTSYRKLSQIIFMQVTLLNRSYLNLTYHRLWLVDYKFISREAFIPAVILSNKQLSIGQPKSSVSFLSRVRSKVLPSP